MMTPARNTAWRTAAFVALLLLSGNARAATGDLYAATGGGGGGNCTGGSLASLYKLDPTDASATLVGAITLDGNQVRHVTGLAMHPSTGVLYGVMNGQDTAGSDCYESTLLTIDPATGVATRVGSQGAITGPIPDITFDPLGTLYAWTEYSDDLLIVSTTDASSTLIDSFVGTFATGLAADSKARLYLKSSTQLSRLNPYTGNPFDDVELDRAAHNMLTFDPSDVMFSGERTSNGLDLFTIDPATGITTAIGSNTVKNIAALAFDRGVLTAPAIADLSIQKDIDEPAVETGANVVFTLTVNNDGPGTADNVVVYDPVPGVFSFVSASGDGSYDDSTGEWTISSIASGSSATIEITLLAAQSGAYNNIAEVVSSDSYDSDSVPGSGDSNGDTYVDVVGTVSDPTLFSIDRDSEFLWTLDPTFGVADSAQAISLANHDICGGNGLAREPGSTTLFGVLRVDNCSTRLLVSIDPVTAEATELGSFGGTNIAAITFGADANTLYATSGNNGSPQRKLFTVDPTNGTLTQKCSLAPSTYGRALSYADGFLYDATYVCDSICQLVIHKIDPTSFPADPADPCPDITIETGLDREPTGMTLQGMDSGVAVFTVSSFTQIYAVFIPGQSADADWSFLRTTGHNSKGLAYDGAPITRGNLTISKFAAKSRVKGDKFIEYTLQATNSGPDAISNVVVSDPLPFGTTFVSAGSDCQESGGTVTCSTSFLDASSSQNFFFTVQVTCKKCSSISNTATISTTGDAYEYPYDNQSTINTSVKGKF